MGADGAYPTQAGDDDARSRAATVEATQSKEQARLNSVRRFSERGISLPTFAQLADPSKIEPSTLEALKDVDPDTAHPLNLYRMHWHNSADRRGVEAVPGYVVLPESLTGVRAPILVALGERLGHTPCIHHAVHPHPVHC